jgi:hypothetical protein
MSQTAYPVHSELSECCIKAHTRMINTTLDDIRILAHARIRGIRHPEALIHASVCKAQLLSTSWQRFSSTSPCLAHTGYGLPWA